MHRRQFISRAAELVTVTATAGAATILVGDEPSPTHAKIRVGVVGTSHAHAAGKVTSVRQLADEFELVGVVDPDDGLRQKLNSEPGYHGVRWLSERDLLSSRGLRAVIVETAAHDLVPTALRCVNAGLHVHLDKPAGESLAEFEALLAAATHRRVHVQLGYMLRYNPAFEQCFRLVRDGILGQVFEVHGVMSKKVDASARVQLSRYRGGAMFELGCHLVDALVTVLGPPDGVTAFIRKSGQPPAELADNQLAVFEYAKATATIRSTLIEPYGVDRRQFVVCGENGAFEIRPLEPPSAQLTLEARAGEFSSGPQRLDFPQIAGRYDEQLRDFAAVIRGERPPRWNAEHDLATQRAILQASGLPIPA